MGNPPDIDIDYRDDSSINGGIRAYNDGSIDIAPVNSSSMMKINGDILAYAEEMTTTLNTGGIVSADLNDGSLFTGKALIAPDSARIITLSVRASSTSTWQAPPSGT